MRASLLYSAIPQSHKTKITLIHEVKVRLEVYTEANYAGIVSDRGRCTPLDSSGVDKTEDNIKYVCVM